jgi:hypothetical protein
MAEGWRSFLSAWEEFRPEMDEIRELDDERVLVLSRYSGRGKVSGLEIGKVGTERAALYQFRGGKVTKIVRYLNRERGLAELRLAPEVSTRSPRGPLRNSHSLSQCGELQKGAVVGSGPNGSGVHLHLAVPAHGFGLGHQTR